LAVRVSGKRACQMKLRSRSAGPMVVCCEVQDPDLLGILK
jgi:hypothetical protein